MSIWHSALAALLPQDCLLCGAPAANAALCAACRADLPALPAERCPVCADTSPSGQRCGACLSKPPHFDETLVALPYHFPADKLVHSLKYMRRLATADLLATAMLAGPRPTGDLIVPLPLHPNRLAERGFNQSVEIGRHLARATGLPMQVDAGIRVRDTVPLASLPWQARRKAIRHAFEVPHDLAGKKIIVIDDVMTSGATLDEFARMLKAAGAIHVCNWVATRTYRDAAPTTRIPRPAIPE